MKSIILIAPPSAGKGTVSNIIKEKYNMAHISTGDLLREAAKDNLEIKETLEKGLLVTDEVVLELLKNRITKEDCANGYILDGFPRTISQAIAYEKILEDLKREIGCVVYLEIDKETAKKRVVGRISCPQCGAIYNEYFDKMKPQVENICDKCGTELTRRTDDNEETFNKRFDTYMEKTSPLIDYYDKLGLLNRVSSNQGSSEAALEIENLIK
ncbi:MAG: nucleoside monophosphate kinase [Bacilli bacterium]|nr:nucleoside monophosphate kinase [Bacilli bacterium]